MALTLQARTITLRDLIEKFGLQLVRQQQFFPEWQTELPQVTEAEKQFLDKVRDSYFNLVDYPPLLEKAVQLSILSPLLFLGDFYLPPFHIRAEESVEIAVEDEGTIIHGNLDIFLLKNQFWVMAIESKEVSFSIEAGLAQLLTYMLANPHPERPGFGMVTTGGSFIFVKLVRGELPRYATSKIFELRNPGNELYDVLSIMRRIGQL
jgi:hypothetical protein